MDDSIKEENDSEKKITIHSFIINDRPEGFQVKMQSNMEMSVSERLPKSVKGTVRIDGQVVPIIDLQAKKGYKPQQFLPDSCIIIRKQNHGEHTILTGTFHEDTSEVLKIISKKR